MAGCYFNTNNRKVYPPGLEKDNGAHVRFYEELQRVRRSRLLNAYLLVLPAALKREIVTRLEEKLTQLGVAVKK